MKRLSGVLIFVILLTTACSSAQQSASPTTPESAPEAEKPAIRSDPDKKLTPTDTDVMYHVLAAETLGGEGDFAGAAAQYLEAALLSDDPNIAKRAATVAVSAGAWPLVVLASDRWATLDPESLDARELAAGSRLREGDFVGAEYQLAQILDITASDQATGWQIVTSLLAPVNDGERVTKVLDNLLRDFDAESNPDALFARSKIAARFGDLNEATRLIDHAIVVQPDRAELLAWAGRLAMNTGNASLAIKRYREAWNANPVDQRIALSYAELLKRNNDLVTAQSVLTQVPDIPEMRFARIIFAADAGDMANAELLYSGFAGAKYEDVSDAAFHAAQSAELLDRPLEAIEWYEQVTGERSLRAITRQAFLLANLGDVEKAQNLMVELRNQPDPEVVAQSYQVEVQILQNAGREDEAMQLLNDALTDLPADVSLRYTRSLIAVALNQLELAESDLRQIISVEPDNAAAINALGYTLADLTERYAEAEELILKAYEMEPEDPSIIDSMGWISYRLGRLREAETYMREAWKVLRSAEVAAHLGEVLWARGQKDEALSLWQLGLQLESDNKVLINTMQRFGEAP